MGDMKSVNGELFPLTLEEQAEHDAAIAARFSPEAVRATKTKTVEAYCEARALGGFDFSVQGFSMFVPTDVKTSFFVESMMNKIRAGEQLSIDWNGDKNKGYVTLNNALITAVYNAGFAFTQKCYSAAKVVILAIDSYETDEKITAAFDQLINT